MRTCTNSHGVNRLNLERFAGSQLTTPPSEPSRILIVDDDASSRLGFRVTLESAGYEVTEAEDGEEAMECLRTDPADLALLDLRMPLLDGIETLQSLRDEGIDVPVVVITAHGSVSSTAQAMKLGALDVLPKPLKPSTLRQTVFEALMRRGRTVPEPSRPTMNSIAVPAQRYSETLAVARKAWKQGQFALAETLVDRAIDLDPDSAESAHVAGNSQGDSG